MESIKDLKLNTPSQLPLLIKNVEKGLAKNGAIYQTIFARDKDGNEFIIRNFNELIEVTPPCVKSCIVTSGMYKDAVSYTLNKCLDCDEPIDLFTPKAQVDVTYTWNEIVRMVKSLRPSLMYLVSAVLTKDKDAYFSLPLNPIGAYARRCGLMEASLKLAKLAEADAILNGLDRDLCVASALLYYVGKLDTITSGYTLTPDDILMGIGMSTVMRIQDKVRDIKEGSHEDAKNALNETDIKLLCHIVNSRFKGIPTAIPEAIALRYLDAQLIEIDEAKNAIENAENDSVILNNESAFNKKIYKR